MYIFFCLSISVEILITFGSPSGSGRTLPFFRIKVVIQLQLNNRFHLLARVNRSGYRSESRLASEFYQIFYGIIRKRDFFTGIVDFPASFPRLMIVTKMYSAATFPINLGKLAGKGNKHKAGQSQGLE